MRSKKALYIAVTADELELPMTVCDTISELARWADMHRDTIYEYIRSHEACEIYRCKFIKILVKF